MDTTSAAMPVRRSIKALSPRPVVDDKSASNAFASSRSDWPRPRPVEPYDQGFVSGALGSRESTIDHLGFRKDSSCPSSGDRCMALHNQLLRAQSNQDQEPPETGAAFRRAIPGTAVRG